jgi:hypothetical protein
MCRQQTCTDPDHPLLDYSREEGKCVCREHPCNNVDGKHHDCLVPSMPHLHFRYDKDRKLTCECSKNPLYSPIYLAKELCPGQACDDPEHPVLDWDESSMNCLCNSHPCWSDHGVTHNCPDPKMPTLQYREEENKDELKKFCECGIRIRERKYHIPEL